MAGLITPLLVIQLLLSFFAPPIPWGQRHVFPADVFCLLWIGPAVVWALRASQLAAGSKKRLALWLWASALALGAVFLHGYVRPPLESPLLSVNFGVVPVRTGFDPLRELVVAIRFLSWLWAAGLSAMVFAERLATREHLTPVLKALSVSIPTIVAAMIAARLVPAFQGLLEHLYGYDSSYYGWVGRSYGPFPSPVEAGAALGLSIILVLGFAPIPAPWKAAVIAAGAGGLILTGTMTAAAAAVLAVILALIDHIPRRRKLRFVAAGLGVATAMAALAYSLDPGGVAQKFADLGQRAAPWMVHLRALVSRWDLLILGLGLHPYAIDNSYLFVLTRGGLLGLAFATGLGWWAGSRLWPGWSGPQRAIAAYLLLSALTFDAIIFRNLVYLMIVLGIPLLASPRRSG